MNFRQIEIFKAIMDTGSVTEAADRLSVTQPSVSKHLRLLEHGLGIDLFTRTGNRLNATPEAEALYEQVERVYTGLDHLRGFAEDLRNHRQGGVTIAVMPLLAQDWLPKMVAPFLVQNENISMSLPIRSSRWIATAVAARRADFGLGLLPNDNAQGIIASPLMDLPLVCVVPRKHKLAKRRIIKTADLESEHVIVLRNFDRWQLTLEGILDESYFSPKRFIETFSVQVACELARRGAGVALVDVLTASRYQKFGLSIHRFEPKVSLETCVLTPEHWPLSELSKRLIAELQTQAAATERELKALLS